MRFITKKYTLEDCLEVIKSFHAEHGRVPTREEIKILHKQGKSPSAHVFSDKGGLAMLSKEAGLKLP